MCQVPQVVTIPFTFAYCAETNMKIRRYSSTQPHISLESLPVGNQDRWPLASLDFTIIIQWWRHHSPSLSCPRWLCSPLQIIITQLSKWPELHWKKSLPCTSGDDKMSTEIIIYQKRYIQPSEVESLAKPWNWLRTTNNSQQPLMLINQETDFFDFPRHSNVAAAWNCPTCSSVRISAWKFLQGRILCKETCNLRVPLSRLLQSFLHFECYHF